MRQSESYWVPLRTHPLRQRGSWYNSNQCKPDRKWSSSKHTSVLLKIPTAHSAKPWKIHKGCRLGWGKSWMGQAEDSILQVCQLTEFKKNQRVEKVPRLITASLYETLLPENLGKHCWEWPAGKTESKIKLLIQEQIKPQDLILCIDGSVTKDQSGWGFTVKQGATAIHEDNAAYTVSTSSLTMEVEVVTHALRQTALKGDSQTTHAIILTDWMSLLQKVKVEWEAKIGMHQWSTSILENSCGCTALNMQGWREMTKKIDWQVKQPSQRACVLEDLKCWGAWDTMGGYKAKDIIPSIA